MTSTLIFLLLLLPILLLVMVREFRAHGVTIFLNALCWILVIYLLMPYVMSIGDLAVVSPRFVDKRLDLDNIRAMVLVSFGILTFIFGHGFSRRVKVFSGTGGFISLASGTRKNARFALLLLGVGVLSLLIFISIYGGVQYVTSNLSAIRSGVDVNKNYFAAFIRTFTIYIQVGFYVLLAIFLSRDGGNFSRSLLFKALLGVAFLFVVIKLFGDGGRQVAINFLFSCFVVFYTLKKRIPVGFCVAALAFSVIYVLFGKIFIFQLLNPDFDAFFFIHNQAGAILASSFNDVGLEFTHQYLSLVNLIHAAPTPRMFGDYIYWMMKPLKLIGYDVPDSISYFNTYMVRGVWDSEIPPGLIAFGYASFGLPGVVAHCFIIGFIIGKLDKFFAINRQSSVILISFYALLVSDIPYLISNGDPALFFQNRIPHIFLIFLIYIYFRKSLKLVPLREPTVIS